MSEAGTTARTSDDAERRRTTNPITFVGQIVDELRKVVRPTRSELLNYVLVVIVFVTVMMALVSALDFVFTKLVFWAFAA
ncbi:preprotein translocase subunit SecE [Janibacter massiliensis]|uniref:preprotein translocase subunit SecE n=1 Tax=Janibacter massiliensis TaxID=2058291 RepID=UPI000D0F5BB0|nr:preprotein translocase subunit SecE [Janibacter massiliensis]